MTPYGISRYEYDELRAFCRQYPDKLRDAARMINSGGHALTGMPSGGRCASCVERAAEKRERYLRDCDLIDSVAEMVDSGMYKRALIQHICYGVPYCRLDTADMPSSRRNRFFRAKRDFFQLLSEKKLRI